MALSHTFHNPARFLTGIFCILLSMLVLPGCSGDKSCNKIQSLISKEVKSDADYTQLVHLLKRNTGCLDTLFIKNGIVKNGVVDEDKLKEYFFNTNTKTDTIKSIIKVNIFLENSASMWGYFEGATECESVLSKIVVHSGYFFSKEDLKFSFITDQIFEQKLKQNDVLKFVSKIEPEQLRVGNFKNTEISDIINTVINKTEKDNFSILISDCIYSQQAGVSKVDAVNYEWTLIEKIYSRVLEYRYHLEFTLLNNLTCVLYNQMENLSSIL